MRNEQQHISLILKGMIIQSQYTLQEMTNNKHLIIKTFI